MFNLKTTELNASLIGAALGFLMIEGCAFLVLHFWLPVLACLLFFGGVLYLAFWCVFRIKRKRAGQIGIDERGAYWQVDQTRFRLFFIRVNGVQLIARQGRNGSLWQGLFSRYRVIYRDSLSYDTYRLLRSYAAQQRLLGEVNKEI